MSNKLLPYHTIPLIISIICISCLFHLCIICYFYSSNVNCIVYARMYVHSFSYCVNKLDIQLLYLSPIEIYGSHFSATESTCEVSQNMVNFVEYTKNIYKN